MNLPTRIFGLRPTEEQVNRIGEQIVLKGADPEQISRLLVTIIVPPPFLGFSTAKERIECMQAKRTALRILTETAISLGIKVPWEKK